MKKILLFSAALAIASISAATAGGIIPPPAQREGVQVAEAAVCLGFASDVRNAQLVLGEFHTDKTYTDRTWTLTPKARQVRITREGTCDHLPSPKAGTSFHPTGVAYIPNPPEGNASLVEMSMAADGSRVFTDGE